MCIRDCQSADQHLVEFSRWLNSTWGGDEHTKGVFDLNPAKMEYILNGYLGGAISFPMKATKWIESLRGKREFEWRHVPLLNRVVKSGDERTESRKLNNEYYKFKKEAEKTGYRYKEFLKDKEGGILGAAEKVDFIYNSDEFLRYQLFETYNERIKQLEEALKSDATKDEKMEWEKELNNMKRELVESMQHPREAMEKLKAEAPEGEVDTDGG